MPLTDVAIKNAKPRPKSYKLADGGGLYVDVSPAGGKVWRYKYRWQGAEKRLTLGAYPEVSGPKARRLHATAREQLAAGIDPGAAKRAAKVAQAGTESFEGVARAWYEANTQHWSASYRYIVARVMDRDVYPYIGKLSIAEIKSRDVLDVIRRIKARGAEETARRSRVLCGQVFRYAIQQDKAENDPTQALKGEKRIVARKHYAAFTEPSDVSRLMRAIEGYRGTPEIRAALKLSALLFQRPGEIRRMDWREIDLDAAQWRYLVAKTKTPHIVPLSIQAVAVLRDLHPLTGTPVSLKPDAPHFVLPSARSRLRPMSENGVRQALRTLGFTNDEMTAHGFRAMARSLLAERNWKPDAIERQLAHKASGPLGAAYDRAQFLTERTAMMQSWADYLDSLANENTKVVALRRA